MAILLAGTSPADFTAVGGTITADTTPANKAPYAREGVACLIGRGGVADLASKETEVWVSFYFKGSRGTLTSGSGHFLALFDTSYSLVNALWSLRSTSATNIQIGYWSGTAFVSIGEIPGLLNATIHRVDMHVKMANSGGVIEVYLDSLLVFTSGITDTLYVGTGFDRLQFYKHAQIDSSTSYFSGIIVSTEDTRGMEFVECYPIADGTETGWTGTYADIDEIGIDDADFIAPTAAGDISTFDFSTIPAGLTEYDIKSVVLSARGQKGGSSPTQYDFVTKIAGTKYYSNPSAPLFPSFGPSQTVFDVNPATSSNWLKTEVESAEFGVRSIA